MVRVVVFRSEGHEFKSSVELISGGFNSACHPSKVGKMSASLLVSCIGVATHPGLCPIAKDCLGSTNALHSVWSRWMDGWIVSLCWTMRNVDKSKYQIKSPIVHNFYCNLLTFSKYSSFNHSTWHLRYSLIRELLQKKKKHWTWWSNKQALEPRYVPSIPHCYQDLSLVKRASNQRRSKQTNLDRCRPSFHNLNPKNWTKAHS